MGNGSGGYALPFSDGNLRFRQCFNDLELVRDFDPDRRDHSSRRMRIQESPELVHSGVMHHACLRIFQSLYLIPSHCASMKDPLSLRPAMVCFGNLAGWSMTAVLRKEKIHFSRTAVFAALVMAIIHACGVKTFFFALDGFASVHLGGLAMPLMLGINLLGFSLYSLIFLKEKRRLKDALSAVLILAGLILLGFRPE